MEALNTLGEVLKDYDKNGFRVSVEVSQQELLKLFAWVAGTALFVALSLYLLKGIFSAK